MRDWFFYQERGKTIGPLTGDDLRARIRDGRVRPFDMIYKEGELGWRMAFEFTDLRAEFQASATAGMHEKPWVILHRKSPENFEFQTLGPHSADEVREAIKSGQISYNDYIWQAGYPEWKRIGAVEDFNPRAVSAANRKAKADAPTVMVPVNSKGEGIEMPPVPEAAVELLRNVVEFKRGKISGEDSKKPDEAAGEDLTKIVRSEPAFDPDATRVVAVSPGSSKPPPVPVPVTGGKPPKAEFKIPSVTPDTQTGINTSSRISSLTGAGSSESTIVRSVDDVLHPRPKKKRRSRRRQAAVWTDWGIVGSLVTILVAVIAYSVHRLKAHSNIPEPPVLAQSTEGQGGSAGDLQPPSGSTSNAGPETLPPLSTSPSPPPVSSSQEIPPPVTRTEMAPEEAEDVPSAASAKPLRREPTQLFLVAQAGTNGQARIEVRSNGTAEYPVYLQIVGLPGQVGDAPSFYRYLRLKPTGSVNHPLDIPPLKLRPGRYVVHVESADLKKDANLSLSVGESSYKQAVAKTRKKYAAAIWNERQTLYRLCLALENALTQAVGGKKLAPRGLESLVAVKRTNGANYIFFDDWWELKQILQDAKDGVTSAEIDRARRVREKIATYSVWKPK